MAPKPIRFSCTADIPLPAEEIASQILDLSQWPNFAGYGILPGIQSAEFVERTVDILGTTIRVTNRDGSTHLEEITVWEPSRHIALRMHGFSKPVSQLATHFVESWDFKPNDSSTHVTRSFELHPRSHFTRPLLWLISFFLQAAIQKHLQKIAMT